MVEITFKEAVSGEMPLDISSLTSYSPLMLTLKVEMKKQAQYIPLTFLHLVFIPGAMDVCAHANFTLIY